MTENLVLLVSLDGNANDPFMHYARDPYRLMTLCGRWADPDRLPGYGYFGEKARVDCRRCRAADRISANGQPLVWEHSFGAWDNGFRWCHHRERHAPHVHYTSSWNHELGRSALKTNRCPGFDFEEAYRLAERFLASVSRRD